MRFGWSGIPKEPGQRVRVLSDTWFRKYLGACASSFPIIGSLPALAVGICDWREKRKLSYIRISRLLSRRADTRALSFALPRSHVRAAAFGSAWLSSPPPPPLPPPRRTAGAGGKQRRRPCGYQTRAWRTTKDDAQLRRGGRGQSGAGRRGVSASAEER